jgi:Family of unknown function (DUF6504)
VSKRYDEAIEVVADSVPISFSWRGRRYVIDQQLSTWREGAEWWHARSNGGVSNEKRARDRDCYRVLARPAGSFATGELDPDGFMASAPTAVYDIAFDRIQKAWKLSRIWD